MKLSFINAQIQNNLAHKMQPVMQFIASCERNVNIYLSVASNRYNFRRHESSKSLNVQLKYKKTFVAFFQK